MAGTFIASGVLVQVELMIGFCVPPFTRRKDLSHNLAASPPFLTDLLSNILGYRSLLLVICEDSGSILRAGVRALTVGCSRVMHFVEELDELPVCDLLRVVNDLQSLGICGAG